MALKEGRPPTASGCAHWCNEQGDIDQPYQQPPKHIKNLFRGELARQLAKREVMEFLPQE